MTKFNESPLNVSDEDFLNSSIDFSAVSLDDLPTWEGEAPLEKDPSNDEPLTDEASTEEGDDTQNESLDYVEEGEETEEAQEPSTDPTGGDQEEELEQEEEDAENTPEAPKTDLEAYGDISRIFAPFKANGKEVQVDSVDDVIALMQMGANYNKKMAALKPNLKVLKTLEANGLLDPDKINYLIDLDKKDPAAIGKLLQDSEYDAYSQDEESIKNYRPTEHTISDNEMAISEVVESINHSPRFEETARILLQEWDEASKQEVIKQPEIIRYINEHVHNGVYDIIAKELEKERILGRLNGVPALLAYQQTGDRLAREGAFDHLNPSNTQNQPKPQARIVKPANGSSDAARQKKRAVTPPKSVSSNAPFTDELNPLNMSDEEFNKLFSDRFI